MLTLRAMRMMRLVRLRLSTSELVEARDMTSRAVVSRGASCAAARPGREDYYKTPCIYEYGLQVNAL